MDYKVKLNNSLKKHFLDELGNTDIKISPDLSKFLIPTLLKCLETSLNKSLLEVKSAIDSELNNNTGG